MLAFVLGLIIGSLLTLYICRSDYRKRFNTFIKNQINNKKEKV